MALKVTPGTDGSVREDIETPNVVKIIVEPVQPSAEPVTIKKLTVHICGGEC